MKRPLDANMEGFSCLNVKGNCAYTDWKNGSFPRAGQRVE